MKRQIGEVKAKGVITEAATEWAAPVILVSKNSPDGKQKYRFCADFRVIFHLFICVCSYF
jgi:hypothetical protein